MDFSHGGSTLPPTYEEVPSQLSATTFCPALVPPFQRVQTFLGRASTVATAARGRKRQAQKESKEGGAPHWRCWSSRWQPYLRGGALAWRHEGSEVRHLQPGLQGILALPVRNSPHWYDVD